MGPRSFVWAGSGQIYSPPKDGSSRPINEPVNPATKG